MYKKIFTIFMLFSTSIFANESLVLTDSLPIHDDLRFHSIIRNTKGINETRKMLPDQHPLETTAIFFSTAGIKESIEDINKNTTSLILSYPKEKTNILKLISVIIPSYPYTIPDELNQNFIEKNLSSISQLLSSIFDHDKCCANFFTAITKKDKGDIFRAAQQAFKELKESYTLEKNISKQYNDIIRSDVTLNATATAIVTSFLPSSGNTTAKLPEDLDLDILSSYKNQVVALLNLMKIYGEDQKKLPDELQKPYKEIWKSPLIDKLFHTSNNIFKKYSCLEGSLSTENEKLALNILLFQTIPSLSKNDIGADAIVKNTISLDDSNKTTEAAPSSCVIQ